MVNHNGNQQGKVMKIEQKLAFANYFLCITYLYLYRLGTTIFIWQIKILIKQIP